MQPAQPWNGRAPVADATGMVLAWLDRAGIAATVGPPIEAPERNDPVRLWPLALLPDQALRSSGQTDALRLRIRFLVTSGGWGPAGATPLDRLLVAAAADTSVHLVIEPIPDTTWRALGLRPQAALQIELPIRIARTVVAPPRVRAPLRVDGAPLIPLRGRVLGPGDIPVPGVRIAAVGLGTAALADGHGEFVLDAVPAVGPTRLVVTGKGLHLDLEVEPSTQPVDLHCAFEEA